MKNKLSLPFPLLLSLATLNVNCAKEGEDNPRPSVEAPAAAPSPTTVPAPAAVARPEYDVGGSAVRVPVDGLPSFGNPSAPVTIVAFTDYECPYCAKADDRIAQLRAEYGDRVRLVVASHPLPMHEHAAPAARAFLAAVELGKGEAMHARLFAKTDRAGAPNRITDEDGLRAAAHDVGLDVAAFDNTRRGSPSEAALSRAEKLGATLSVEGTPTFFVNGRRLVGARPIEAFRALIDEELAKAKLLTLRGIADDRIYATIVANAADWVPPKTQGEGIDKIVDVGIDDAPLRGGARSPVTIVFFSDFECPFCVKAENTLRSVEAANPGQVRVAFRHKPLPMHVHARLAAKASVAAERQGRFWEYHDVLLAHRDALTREDLVQYASEVGLDRARFARDLEDPAIDQRIAADEQRAEQLGVKGTPTAFVNGQRITGAQPLATWLTAVERSLARR